MSSDQERFEELFNPKIAERITSLSGTSGGYSALLGIAVTKFEPGRVVCTLPIRDELRSAVGLVHGGAISSLIDHTISLAVYPLVEAGKWVATQEFKLNYLRPGRDGDLVATGEVLSLRKRLAVARVEVRNDGELLAVAQGTLYIRDPA